MPQTKFSLSMLEAGCDEELLWLEPDQPFTREDGSRGVSTVWSADETEAREFTNEAEARAIAKATANSYRESVVYLNRWEEDGKMIVSDSPEEIPADPCLNLSPDVLEAIRTLLAAAEVRRDQWSYVARGDEPSESINELYESGPDEGRAMERLIGDAIRKVEQCLQKLGT